MAFTSDDRDAIRDIIRDMVPGLTRATLAKDQQRGGSPGGVSNGIAHGEDTLTPRPLTPSDLLELASKVTSLLDQALQGEEKAKADHLRTDILLLAIQSGLPYSRFRVSIQSVE